MKTIFMRALFCAFLSSYALSSHGQADEYLSNLKAPTAINRDLLPNTLNTKDLGSILKSWKNVYFSSGLYLSGNPVLHATGNNNFFIGRSAGNFTLTGSYNTGIGQNALSSLTSGAYNTAGGYGSLNANTSGDSNTAYGYRALYSNISGNQNTAIGFVALYTNNTGHENVAVGTQSLYYNLGGSFNTASGVRSLFHNTNGFENTASGYHAMYHNTLGFNNTATGYKALDQNIDGSENTAVGINALYYNQYGHKNTATGALALYKTTGGLNTANGYFSLDNNTEGNYNTALGAYTMEGNTIGYANTALGYAANVSAGDLSNGTAVGFGSLVTASNQVRIGNSAVTSIGGFVDWTDLPSDSRFKKNVLENVPGLEFIKQLRAVTYTVDVESINKRLAGNTARNSTGNKALDSIQSKALAEKSREVHTGFIAQEVELAAKKLHFDFNGVDAPKNTNDLYGLRYSKFVVPIVKAVQELSKIMEEKDAKIEALQKQLNEMKVMIAGIKNNSSSSSAGILPAASLGNNTPNPFAHSTSISYSLPKNYKKALLLITNQQGMLLKQVVLSGKDQGIVDLDADTLTAGVYNYSLIVDGATVVTKQMVMLK